MDKRKTLATYQKWIQQLQHLEKKQDFVWVNNGEVWRYNTGINVGNEVSFKRPCLVVKHSFWKHLSLIVPISTKQSAVNSGYTLKLKKYPVDARLILNQMGVVDKKRFIKIHRKAPRYSKAFLKVISDNYKSFL